MKARGSIADTVTAVQSSKRNSDGRPATYVAGLLLPDLLGWSAQTWEANSLSSRSPRLSLNSSKDVPVDAFEASNRQPHSEQPNPPRPGCSIHTILRLMGASVAGPQRVPGCCPETKCAGSPLTAPLAAMSCLIAAENRHPVWGCRQLIEVWAKLTCANLDGLSGILHTWNGFVRANIRSCGRRLQ
jgi:hypothetical protein